MDRAASRALIGGDIDIHIFAFCPANIFWNQLLLDLIAKEIRWADGEDMNTPPPHYRSSLGPANRLQETYPIRVGVLIRRYF